MNSIFRPLLTLCVLTYIFVACEKHEATPQENAMEMIAGSSKKDWVVASATVEVLRDNAITNTYALALDCEADDIWQFNKNGDFFKLDNLTKCKGEPNAIKTTAKWNIDDNINNLAFTKWRFLNNKEADNLSFSLESLTDSTMTFSKYELFPNTKKFKMVLRNR